MPTWLGGWEWVILAVIALVVFGGSRLANAGKNAGKAIREFKEETSTLKKSDAASPAIDPAPPTTQGTPQAAAAGEPVIHEAEIVPDPKDKGQQP